MNVVECNGLTKVYGSVKAINDISLDLQENKITGFIGRNGAGKTTLLKTIAGFLPQTSGKIKVFSENPFNNLKVAANMIYIDDNITFPTSICLTDILEMAEGFYPNWDTRLATGLFDYFSFQPTQSHDSLSKGMKSTFNMILGISARCPLTLFDEPTTGMDAAVRKDFYRALLKDYLNNPRTILLSSHLLNEIEDILEDVLLIREGKKILHISVPDLKEYAIGLRGKGNVIDELIKNMEIYHKEGFGKDNSYVVVRNDFSESWLKNTQLIGVEISPVTTNDLCVYLTDRKKGGIDDVFNRI